MSENGAEKDAGVETITRRRHLTMRAVLGGASIWLATEAVASTAIEHPEWDMDERRTWDEWERDIPPPDRATHERRTSRVAARRPHLYSIAEYPHTHSRYIFNFRDDNAEPVCSCIDAARWPEPTGHHRLAEECPLERFIADVRTEEGL